MSFYEQLAAETADARNTLLSSPIVADCLRGEVSMPSYLAFLGQAFHHVRHTTPLLMSLGGKLPERLEDLVTEPGNSAGWLGPYAKASALKDPWNTPIQYRAPGDGVPFEIVSLGNDRKAGGSGVDKDISSKD